MIDEFEPGFVTSDPATDPAAGDLPGNERQQQLHADFDNRVDCGAAIPVHVEQQRYQQRCQEDAEQTGRRRAADGRRDIAAGQGRKGNRRLHGGRQGAEVEHAHVQLVADQRRQHWLERQAQQRKQYEGQAEHQQMQTPVAGTGDDSLARQLGAVQEKQQRDGQVGDPAERHGGLAAGGQQ